MIESEWKKGGNYVKVETRLNDTENRHFVKEIVVRINNIRSCHSYDETLLKYFINKLSEEK
jgi:hypothetical protein